MLLIVGRLRSFLSGLGFLHVADYDVFQRATAVLTSILFRANRIVIRLYEL